MKYDRSPLPYLIVLLSIIIGAIYCNFNIDNELDSPLVFSIEEVDAPEADRSLALDVHRD